MKNCSECQNNCVIRARFSTVFDSAREELRKLHKRQSDINADEYWVEIGQFCDKYPDCVLEILEEMMIESYLESEKRKLFAK